MTAQNLQILADENKSLSVRYMLEGSTGRIKTYGSIQNVDVWVCRSYSGTMAANLAAPKDVTRKRRSPTQSSSPQTLPAQILGSNSQEQTVRESQTTVNSSALSFSTKRKASNEEKPDNRIRRPQKPVKARTNRVKREPSDIFKSFSISDLKSDSGRGKSSALEACEAQDLESVSGKVILEPF